MCTILTPHKSQSLSGICQIERMKESNRGTFFGTETKLQFVMERFDNL